jgi:hypothetical protein
LFRNSTGVELRGPESGRLIRTTIANCPELLAGPPRTILSMGRSHCPITWLPTLHACCSQRAPAMRSAGSDRSEADAEVVLMRAALGAPSGAALAPHRESRRDEPTPRTDRPRAPRTTRQRPVHLIKQRVEPDVRQDAFLLAGLPCGGLSQLRDIERLLPGSDHAVDLHGLREWITLLHDAVLVRTLILIVEQHSLAGFFSPCRFPARWRFCSIPSCSALHSSATSRRSRRVESQSAAHSEASRDPPSPDQRRECHRTNRVAPNDVGDMRPTP